VHSSDRGPSTANEGLCTRPSMGYAVIGWFRAPLLTCPPDLIRPTHTQCDPCRRAGPIYSTAVVYHTPHSAPHSVRCAPPPRRAWGLETADVHRPYRPHWHWRRVLPPAGKPGPDSLTERHSGMLQQRISWIAKRTAQAACRAAGTSVSVLAALGVKYAPPWPSPATGPAPAWRGRAGAAAQTRCRTCGRNGSTHQIPVNVLWLLGSGISGRRCGGQCQYQYARAQLCPSWAAAHRMPRLSLCGYLSLCG
jgi:hypothetical protein